MISEIKNLFSKIEYYQAMKNFLKKIISHLSKSYHF